MAVNRYIVGFVAGLVVGVAATSLIDHRKGPQPWIDTGAAWILLPSQADAGPLPKTFATPPRAFDYGATTKALAPTVAQSGPVILRLDLGKVSGKVGLSLDKPDGSALASKEHPLTEQDSGTSAYFRLTGAQGPLSVLVRNYGDEGHPGSVEIKAMTYAPEAKLDADAMSTVNKAGVY